MVTSSVVPTYDTMSYDQKARVAFMRFGLGPKYGWRERLGTRDIRQACLDELNLRTHLIPDTQVTVKGNDGVNHALTYDACGICATNLSSRPFLPSQAIAAERAARHVKYTEPEIGFVERLVLFWNNHFSILGGPTTGHMERSVIRANVLGNFSDMLKGVIGHAAMVVYLNNDRSVGPNSTFAQRMAATYKDYSQTYNENLAREILELHTLGLNGGYTQTDIISFAKILTGWTIYVGYVPPTGQYFFDPTRHEPGTFRILNRDYGPTNPGQDQGNKVLEDLAAHPATAQHIAYKLLRHFVTDTPDQASVNALAKTFSDNLGNLPKVYEKLLSLPEAWTQPMNRIRQPYHWLVSANRALGNTAADARRDAGNYSVFLSHLDQELWGRVTPDGYPDDNYYWLNGNALRLRKNIAGRLVACSLTGSPLRHEPTALAGDLFGTELSPGTAAAIEDLVNKRADQRLWPHATMLLLSSPEMLRW